MKRIFLLFMLIAAIITWSSGMSLATPVTNTDQFLADGTTLYSRWTNSGRWLFTVAGNNLGNTTRLEEVEEMVKSSLGPQIELVATSFVSSTPEPDMKSGTWQTVAPLGTIEFYAVKAGNAFAMYQVVSPDSTGSWSTYDIWKLGLQGIGGRGGLEVSHFTGYNPGGAPVPEPATMLLLGSGLMGFAVFSRKKLLRK